MSDVGIQPASPAWINGGMQGMVQFAGDDRKFVVFYDKTVHNPSKSAAEGRPVYDVVPYVRIQDPGDNLQIADRPARDDDRQRWPRHFQSFIEGRGTEQPGTPIELLFPANPELVAMFKHMKVTTVQALASLEGTGLNGVGMGAQQFKDKAIKYLSMAKDGEAYAQLTAELARRDAKIAALEAANAQMSERFDAIMKRLEAGPAVEETAPAPAKRARAGEI